MPLPKPNWLDTLPQADRILVRKRARWLYLMREGEVLHRFRVALGFHPEGPKRYEGDGRTPEGHYVVDGFKPDSEFYRAVHISYPNAEDLRRSAAIGRAAGGGVMIHGLDPKIRRLAKIQWMFNWTNGCIAVTDWQMDIVWHSVSLGTAIEIRP